MHIDCFKYSRSTRTNLCLQPHSFRNIKKFIQADLRERKFSNYNRSYFSRLPAWIKSTRNRKEILKAILRLEQMASTIQPLTNK